MLFLTVFTILALANKLPTEGDLAPGFLVCGLLEVIGELALASAVLPR